MFPPSFSLRPHHFEFKNELFLYLKDYIYIYNICSNLGTKITIYCRAYKYINEYFEFLNFYKL